MFDPHVVEVKRKGESLKDIKREREEKEKKHVSWEN